MNLHSDERPVAGQQQQRQDAPRKRGPGRPRGARALRPPSPAEMQGLAPLAPRSWLTEDWRSRRATRLQRLGQWAATTRARLQLSLRDVETLARRDGEEMSQMLWTRLEKMRERPADADDVRRRVSITVIDWMAMMAGQTLSDVDRYLRSGDVADLDPGVETRADTVRSAYLALSPVRRQSLEDFAQHLYHMEEMSQRAAQGAAQGAAMPELARPEPVPEALPEPTPESVLASAAAAQSEVLAVRAELQRALEQMRAIVAETAETAGTAGTAGTAETAETTETGEPQEHPQEPQSPSGQPGQSGRQQGTQPPARRRNTG